MGNVYFSEIDKQESFILTDQNTYKGIWIYQ